MPIGTATTGDDFYGSAPFDALRALDWSPFTPWFDLASKVGGLDEAAFSELCEFVLPSAGKEIAVVGNGPLSTEDRRWPQNLKPSRAGHYNWQLIAADICPCSIPALISLGGFLLKRNHSRI